MGKEIKWLLRKGDASYSIGFEDRWVYFQPGECEERGWLVLRLLYVFQVCLFVGWFVTLCILTYHVRNNYITHIVALQLCFSWLWTAGLSTGVATVSSLAQLQVWDPEKQRQCRYDDVKLTESGKHHKQAATCGAYRAANLLKMAAWRILE